MDLNRLDQIATSFEVPLVYYINGQRIELGTAKVVPDLERPGVKILQAKLTKLTGLFDDTFEIGIEIVEATINESIGLFDDAFTHCSIDFVTDEI